MANSDLFKHQLIALDLDRPVAKSIMRRFFDTISMSLYKNVAQRWEPASDVFKEYVGKISELETDYKCKLELVQEKPFSPYCLLSTDPFGLYTTYIHMDDWNTYMKNLALGGDPPIRKFIQKHSDLMDKVRGAIEGRAETTRQVIKNFLDNVKLGSYNDWPDSFKKANPETRSESKSLQQDAELLFRTVDRAERTQDPERSGEARAGGYAEDGHGRICPDESVGWSWKTAGKPNHLQMENSLYIAEYVHFLLSCMRQSWETSLITVQWLHLSAFSWWGFLGPNSEDQGATNQVPENLVFGTSETNSLMTRYEYAWQKLFTEEEALNKELPKRPIPDGKYTWNLTEPLSMSGEVQQGPSLQNDKIEIATMREIAEKHPFVAYSISYDIEMYAKSYILKIDNPQGRVTFYPFMRPFFHKAENELDKLLFGKMKEMAKLEIAEIKSKIKT
ncbi:MAG: hypothetical protein MMC33_009189 [Icmadophila ericetorum]|nr:hypothetical protein [Icmadophila ericetorum]